MLLSKCRRQRRRRKKNLGMYLLDGRPRPRAPLNLDSTLYASGNISARELLEYLYPVSDKTMNSTHTTRPTMRPIRNAGWYLTSRSCFRGLSSLLSAASFLGPATPGTASSPRKKRYLGSLRHVRQIQIREFAYLCTVHDATEKGWTRFSLLVALTLHS